MVRIMSVAYGYYIQVVCNVQPNRYMCCVQRERFEGSLHSATTKIFFIATNGPGGQSHRFFFHWIFKEYVRIRGYVQDLRNDILMFIHISVLFASQHERTCAVGRAAVSTRAFGGIVLFSLTCAWGPGSTLFRCQHCFMLFNGTYTFEPVLNL